jgi:hypothetical protein
MVSLAKSKFLFLVPALLLFLFFVMTSATKEGAVIKMTTAQKQNMNNGKAQKFQKCTDACNANHKIKGSKPQQDCLLKC